MQTWQKKTAAVCGVKSQKKKKILQFFSLLLCCVVFPMFLLRMCETGESDSDSAIRFRRADVLPFLNIIHHSQPDVWNTSNRHLKHSSCCLSVRLTSDLKNRASDFPLCCINCCLFLNKLNQVCWQHWLIQGLFVVLFFFPSHHAPGPRTHWCLASPRRVTF